ncbi:hypothetical protein AKJ57_04605 [candidate division MSBL1 archaeon SCGC-AAA259A05]|uniref:Transposase IS4-like domain-containing protein n=1 Tax=candidate division MSBL1 archaeon SCGC-AAA259A05 TaxID=1698259 RepID=A0A133U755_9EURY|nr:hypothetical protein AKJ57_04605 [candidate division MSBL1 archaeon SCGC-AAA259A05]
MFLKKNRVKKNGKVYEYAKIVRSVRDEDGNPTHEIVRNLGRMKTEEDWEWAESVLEAMEKEEEVPEIRDLEVKGQFEYGGVLAAGELWEEHGVKDALIGSIEDRKPEFCFERIVFLLAVNRLYEPSSDLSAYRWINERVYPREDLEKQWIYRSLDLLAEEKEVIEENLFEKLMDSLDLSLDLVFYDLTSSYFEGEGPELVDFGYSRDHRSDREQIVLGVVMCEGVPIAHEVWKGNTVDKSTLKETVEQLEKRFEIESMVFVADRGVMTIPNLEELEDVGYEYILSTKRRKDDLAEKLLEKKVSGDEKQKAEEVHREKVEDDTTRRYILCLDQKTRKERLETLKEVRKEKEKELKDLGDRYEKSRKGQGRGRPMTKQGAMNQAGKILGKNKRLFDVNINETIEWELDEEAWKHEKAMAGKFLLVTTSNLKPDKIMEAYKDLKDVEKAFDELKNFFKIRPIYHRTDKRVKGHVYVCILALLLKRLIEKKTDEPFNKTMQELEKLKVSEMEFRGKKILQRNEIKKPQKQLLETMEIMEPPKVLDVVTKKIILKKKAKNRSNT